MLARYCPEQSTLGARQQNRWTSRRARPSLRVSAKRSHYECLGIDVDASDEDVKAAFRRKAKELHPDVNKAPDAVAEFMSVQEAYQTLSDPQARASYDRTTSARGIGFFTQQRRGGGATPRAAPGSGAAEEGDVDQWQRRAGGGWSGFRQKSGSWDDVAAPASEEGGSTHTPDPLDMLSRMAAFLDSHPGASTLQGFASGRLDPWGESSSDVWFRRVEQQSNDPFASRRPPTYGRGFGGDRPADHPEWQPYRRSGDDDLGDGWDGWRRPGSGDEWGASRRGVGGEDEDGRRRGGGSGRRGPPGGGSDFRRGQSL